MFSKSQQIIFVFNIRYWQNTILKKYILDFIFHLFHHVFLRYRVRIMYPGWATINHDQSSIIIHKFMVCHHKSWTMHDELQSIKVEPSYCINIGWLHIDLFEPSYKSMGSHYIWIQDEISILQEMSPTMCRVNHFTIMSHYLSMQAGWAHSCSYV